MRPRIAHGTVPGEDRISVPRGPADEDEDEDDHDDLELDADGAVLRQLTEREHELADLDRVTTAMLIQHLLVPQHSELRARLRGLRTSVTALARRDRTRGHVMRRAAAMLDDLEEAIAEQFAHEELSLFPFLRAGVAPIHALGGMHDHHDDVDGRLRRLRALTTELQTADEVTADTLVLFEGLATLEGLAARHREVEQRTLLTRYS